VVALIVLGCSSSRVVRGERFVVHGHETRDSVVVGTMEAVRDTVREVTTVTVKLNEVGDTTFQSVVRDRDRVSSRDNRAAVKAMTVIKTDTVFVEKRDSVLVKGSNQARASPFEKTLKWVFWIIIAMIGLGIVLKIRT